MSPPGVQRRLEGGPEGGSIAWGNVDATVVELSVVIPVYECEGCLGALHARLKESLASLTPHHEIVFVEDRGKDRSWETLRELASSDEKTRVLRLSRNFGQHAAITAGLSKALGQWVVVMDCDLQDPPEAIPRLIEKAREGYDVVLARRKRKKQSVFRRAASRVYFKALSFFNGRRIDEEYGSFSVIHRKVVDAYLRVNDLDRHYLFILSWLGFETASVDYEHSPRHAGGTSYDLRRLLNHAFNGLFFQTTVLLRWIVYVGFVFAVAGIGLAATIVYDRLHRSLLPGWASLSVLILLVGGAILISTGIAALYIGKIFDQVKGRPLFVIDESLPAENDRQ